MSDFYFATPAFEDLHSTNATRWGSQPYSMDVRYRTPVPFTFPRPIGKFYSYTRLAGYKTGFELVLSLTRPSNRYAL